MEGIKSADLKDKSEFFAAFCGCQQDSLVDNLGVTMCDPLV